jgi:hypothetical protein
LYFQREKNLQLLRNMANRSYLYSLNESPRSLAGLSEWSNAIPVSHLLLASGNPRLVRSYIWETDLPIAIIADYEQGVKRLLSLLDLLLQGDMMGSAELQKQAEETRAFLLSESNRRPMILLEAGEILDMQDKPLDEEAKFILEEMRELGAEVDRLVSLNPKDVFKSTKNHHIRDLEHDMDELGLYWSNELYFHFEDNLN